MHVIPGTWYLKQPPTVESPFSDGGRWFYNGSAVVQTPVQVVNVAGVNIARGSQDGHTAPPYDDSSVYLGAFPSLDYEINARVWMKSPQTGGGNKEFELLLRWYDQYSTITTAYGDTNANGYEMQIAYDGAYANVGRFKGANLQGTSGGPGGGTLNTIPTPANGDLFRASIQGQRIQGWWNSTQLFDYTDNDGALKITTGYPGIGFWANGVASDEIGYSEIWVKPL